MSFADKFGNKGGDKKPESFTDKFQKKSEQTVQSFQDQLKQRGGELVYLVRGKDRGRAAWHYVHVEKNKLPLFLKKVESGTVDVSMYGEVLHSGWGENPPDDIVQQIKEQFGD